jgi:hypothetical protein
MGGGGAEANEHVVGEFKNIAIFLVVDCFLGACVIALKAVFHLP